MKQELLKNMTGVKPQILLEKGVYRHILFKNESDFEGWFEIMTSPEILTINGDMGCYTFKRHESNDMFNYFRAYKPNLDKWHEKLIADSCFEPAKEFSFEAFEAWVNEAIDNFFYDSKLSAGSLIDFKELMKNELKTVEENGQACYDFIYGFHDEPTGFKFYTDDIGGSWDTFTPQFIYCLEAIIYAIKELEKK